MIEPIAWMQRQFTFDQPIGVFPALLERLRGTPARAGELTSGLPQEILVTRVNGKWSVSEHLGHLVDLHPLDDRRLREFQEKVPVLSPADGSNSATEHGNYREVPIAEILGKMRAGRTTLVHRLETLTDKEVEFTAIHPRLQKPLRLLDWVYFVAEHDDHHLACARAAMRDLIRRQPCLK